MITISFIIPVYNAAKTLKRCIESCICQKCNNLRVEIIAIDDGSQDNSLEVLKQMSSEYDCITLFTQENSGVSVSRNRGIEASKSDYLMFVDADDYITTNSIEPCLRQMKLNSIQILVHGGIVEQEDCLDNNIVKSKTVTNGDRLNGNDIISIDTPHSGLDFLKINRGPYKQGLIGGAWGFIFQRELLQNSGVRFIPGLPFGEDSLFVMYLLPYTKSIASTESKFYHYVQNSSSAMHRSHDIMKVAKATLKRCTAKRKLQQVSVIRTDSDLYNIIEGRLISIAFSRIFYRIIRGNYSHNQIVEIQNLFKSEGMWPLPKLPKTYSPYTGTKAILYNMLRFPFIYNAVDIIYNGIKRCL